MTPQEMNEMIARLDERSKSIDEKLDSHNTFVHKRLDAILEQTQKTNGRVDAHAEELKDINEWKNQTIGRNRAMVWISGAIGGLVGAVIGMFQFNIK